MIDLHMHSRYSDDGEHTPSELVEKCERAGVRMMSVTDHNCAKANEEAQRAAKEKGIRYIPGIEIDCTCENINFHVLGYGIDYLDSGFEAVEKNVADQSAQASLERLEKTRASGFSRITEGDMLAVSENSYWKRCWTGEMFAEVLLAMPEYEAHPLLKPYRPGGARSDNPYVNFYGDYSAQGKPCYVKTVYPTMEEIIDTIHQGGGVAVLAHPGVNLKGREFLLEDIMQLGIDGIEAFSSYHSTEQAALFDRAARAHHVFVTCGSDYHGKTKPAIAVGQHGCTVPAEEMEALFGRMCL